MDASGLIDVGGVSRRLRITQSYFILVTSASCSRTEVLT